MCSHLFLDIFHLICSIFIRFFKVHHVTSLSDYGARKFQHSLDRFESMNIMYLSMSQIYSLRFLDVWTIFLGEKHNFNKCPKTEFQFESN